MTDTIVFTQRMPRWVHEELKKIAKNKGVTISAIMRLALFDCITNEQKTERPTNQA